MRSASRRIRTQAEWKVDALTSPPSVSPSMARRRSFEFARGLVRKVMASVQGRAGHQIGGLPRQVAAIGDGGSAQVVEVGLGLSARQFCAAVGGAESG